MGAYLYHEAWNHPYYIGNALVIQRGWYEPCLPVVHSHKVNEEQGIGKGGMCRQGMWLTFRNHRGVELPVFTTWQWDFFFFLKKHQYWTGKCHSARGASFPLSNEEVRWKRGAHLAAAQHVFEKCHSQTRTAAWVMSVWYPNQLLQPPEEKKCSQLKKKGFFSHSEQEH